MEPFGLAFLILSAVLYLLYIWRRNFKLPPGPWGLPIVGYYPFLSADAYLDFIKFAKRYGDVFSLRTVGESLIIVINGLKNIKEVAIQRSDEFVGRPYESSIVPWLSDGLGITQEDGTVWKEHRRFFLQSAKTFGFGKMETEELIHEEITSMIKDIKKEPGPAVDFSYHIGYVVNSVICSILYSTRFEKYSEEFNSIFLAARNLVLQFADKQNILVGPIYEHLIMNLPSTKEIRKGKQTIRKTINAIIDDHLKTFNPGHIRDFIDDYLNEAKKLEEKLKSKQHSFTRERLVGIAGNMIMEGTESVGSTVSILLEEASKHLAEQKLAQQELDAIVGRERLPSWLDRPTLPYLEAFISELYRVAMPFKLSTHYSNFEETEISGYRIPKRSIIILNYWSVNVDPQLYPEPLKFDPRRYLDGSGKKKKMDGPYPFGIGKRSCVGEYLAQVEVFLLIASVLQHFTLYQTRRQFFFRPVVRH